MLWCCAVLSHSSCILLCVTLWTVAHQAPLSRGFSRQEYWSGLPCLPPGDLPDSGIKPTSPALKANFLPSEQTGKPWIGDTLGLPVGSTVKESTCNTGDTGDMGSVPVLGTSPGGRHGNPLQYSCLKNPMDQGAWQVAGVTKSWTRLND